MQRASSRAKSPKRRPKDDDTEESKKIRRTGKSVSELRAKLTLHDQTEGEWFRRVEGKMPRTDVLSEFLLETALPRVSVSLDNYKRWNVTETERKALFLVMYSEFGNWRAGARYVRATRQDIRLWREEDETFRDMMDDAYEDHVDGNETEAYRRAVIGIKPTDQNIYSDNLLNTLLKGQRPDKYGKSVISGPDNGPVQVTRVERVLVRPEERKP